MKSFVSCILLLWFTAYMVAENVFVPLAEQAQIELNIEDYSESSEKEGKTKAEKDIKDKLIFFSKVINWDNKRKLKSCLLFDENIFHSIIIEINTPPPKI
ncbi:MAG: hypothetical protein IPO27_11120 [Bacteroidetes bacterium]|nr:hypothetical protein [Bacteroidota bacterium]